MDFNTQHSFSCLSLVSPEQTEHSSLQNKERDYLKRSLRTTKICANLCNSATEPEPKQKNQSFNENCENRCTVSNRTAKGCKSGRRYDQALLIKDSVQIDMYDLFADDSIIQHRLFFINVIPWVLVLIWITGIVLDVVFKGVNI
jgi:hypothetical protein